MKQADVIVVGGGPAGLLCAGTALGRGKRVLVLEKMPRPARKILVTGKGRCNLTNNCTVEELIAATRRNPRFLYGAFHGFGAQDAMSLFESLGVPLKTERGNRVFPVSEKAMDIADALVRYARGSEIRRAEVTELLLEEGEEGKERRIRGVRCADGQAFYADSVIIATGGLSYPGTGSTGDGYPLAQSAGHTIVSQSPSLIPILCAQKWCADLMGLSLRNVTLTLWKTGSKTKKAKPVYRELGEMLFTHFGVSGPLVLTASTYLEGNPSDYRLTVDLKPGLDEATLDARILRDLEAHAAKDMLNALTDLLPKSIIPVMLAVSGISAETKARSLTREQRQELGRRIRELPLTITGVRPITEAVITSGGVKVSEVDPKTMESKRAKGLFFAGEVLDLDARTGGFNLQIAFSTGHAAGMNC